MEVVVVGAGIGGLALARGLVADGHGVRVLERAPAPRTDGAAVTIFSNGAAAAAGLGVPLHGLGGPIETLEFTDPGGVPFARADLREMRRRTGFGVATVPRAALLHRLAAGLPAGVVRHGCEVASLGDLQGTAGVVRHGCEVASLGDLQGTAGVVRRGCEVTSVDDLQGTADVVVGADGYRSVVRDRVLGDGPATPNGWVSWQGLTRTLPEMAAGVHARCVVGPAGLCGLMPAGDGLLQWWFDVRADAPAGRPVVPWLRERFAGYGGPVRRLLETLPPETGVRPYPHVVHRIPARWGRGATTLLGDAAHAFPPSQAQGANQALEDAWLLRRALAAGGDPAAALRRYERLRVPRVRRISRLAAAETTNRPPPAAARLAGRMLGPVWTARLQLAAIRRCSSVLHDERP